MVYFILPLFLIVHSTPILDNILETGPDSSHLKQEHYLHLLASYEYHSLLQYLTLDMFSYICSFLINCCICNFVVNIFSQNKIVVAPSVTMMKYDI